MRVQYDVPVRRLLVLACVLACLVAAAGESVERPDSEVFAGLTLQTSDGSGSVTVGSFRGRPVLLTFWASWCGPCRIELPELEKLYRDLLGDGFVLLTVNVDTFPGIADRFLGQLGISVPVYRMDQRDLVALDINALPTNILLDRAGEPVMISTGYSPTVPEEIRRLVHEMVPSGGDEDDRKGS